MTSNELRIENYISATSKPDIRKITAEDLLDFDKGKIEIEPIPLTEQWLKDFGFKKNRLFNAYWFSKSLGKGKPKLISNDIGKSAYSSKLEFVFLDIPFESKNIKYVHQLQNLYFALTEKELIKKTL